MRAGQVRCGHCHTVFDGVAALVSLAPQARRIRGRRIHARTPDGHAAQFAGAAAGRGRRRGGRHGGGPAELAAERRRPPPIRRSTTRRVFVAEKQGRRLVPSWVLALAVPILLALLAAQALFHFRDAIAAHWPATKTTLVRLCAVAGCEVHPVSDIAGLSIEASDLQADPAHRGLLILSSTIRNRVPYPLAYPYVELTLSDNQDQVVVRRAFAPEEYLSAAADPRSGIAGNSEIAVKLFIDASATTQAGYQVYLFYP